MGKLPKPFILGLFLALISLPPLPAQTATNAPADTSARVANPALTSQAPADVTNKITDLVHAGKYAEAQQLTAGLLLAYPDDQRLIKTKTLLDKLVETSDSANATPGRNRLTNNVASAQPLANTNSEPLTGMEKVDYNALIELARQAQQTTDLLQQKALLQQFMDQSGLFLQKHPAEIVLWQLRAASALGLNRPVAGYEAGQKLLAMGAADSNDLNLQRLLVQLKNAGWLDQQKAKELQASTDNEEKQAQLHEKYSFPTVYDRGALNPSYGYLTIDEDGAVYDGSDANIRFSKGEIREIKNIDSGYIRFVHTNGKHSLFLPVTESAVAQMNLKTNERVPRSVIDNAIVERWGFVSTDNNKTLKPPKPLAKF
ncbi:MAG: hypothetical protein NVS9B5_36350 [Terriglobales bacterium]